MKIEFSEKQYNDLIELIFLGNWLANATRSGAPGDELIKKYDDIEDYILSFAKDFNVDEINFYEGSYFPTNEFEESLMPLVKEYDDHTFWEVLAIKLAERDLLREIGPVNKLSDKHLERKYDLVEHYEIEFEKHGLKNIVFKGRE